MKGVPKKSNFAGEGIRKAYTNVVELTPEQKLAKKLEYEKKVRQKQLLNEKLKENRQKRTTLDLIHCIVLIPGLCFQFLQELLVDPETRTISNLAQAMRIANTIAVPPLVWFVWKYYNYRLDEMKLLQEAYYKTTLLRSSLLPNLIVESVVNIIHSPPGVLWVYYTRVEGYEVAYSFDSIISIVALTKLYILFRVFLNYTQWASPRSIRICQLNGFTPGFLYALKCYNRSKPVLFLLTTFFLALIVLAFSVQNFERQLKDHSRSPVKFGDSFWNSVWCMVITMTTVGYGEIFPVTIMGRIFTIIACIWGIFFIAMTIVTITRMISMTPEEEKSYQEIIQTDKKAVVKRKSRAAELIAMWYKLRVVERKRMKNKDAVPFSKYLDLRISFSGLLQRYKFNRLNIQNANPLINSIIKRLQDEVTGFTEKGMNDLNIYKNEVTKQVGQIRQNQYAMDVKCLKMLDTSMRLCSFVCADKEGTTIDRLDYLKHKLLYGPDGTKLEVNPVKEFLVLLKDARVPADNFFESIKPQEKISRVFQHGYIKSGENSDRSKFGRSSSKRQDWMAKPSRTIKLND